MPAVKKGDTIIEVIVAITVFCLVSIISINLMNSGISSAEGALELTMARNEIDAQAEALRFLQNSFLAERELHEDQQQYTKLWRRITRGENDCDFGGTLTAQCGLAIEAEDLPEFDLDTCDEAYEDSAMGNNHAFVINTRLIEPYDSSRGANYTDYFGDQSQGIEYSALLDGIVISAAKYPHIFTATQLYPRLIFSNRGYFDENSSDTSNELVEDDEFNSDRLYRMVARAEGIWVIAVRGEEDQTTHEPEFFDFYIRTCWYESGRDYPSAIGTIVRLYNPEVVE